MSDSKSASDKKAERSTLIEEQILEAEKRKMERSFLEELAKRISIAREGKMLSDKKDFSKALVCYRRFFSITAQAMNVELTDLRPQNFEEKTRQAECLMISSIIFDTLKILDMLDTASAKEERKVYHKLFVRFTVGQPFQNFAAENMRKFLAYRKSIKNKQEFWATYNAIRVKKFCVIATWAFADGDCPEVCALRQFRDQFLSAHSLGRAFIDFYYENGIWMRDILARIPGSRVATRSVLKFVVRLF